MTEILVFTFCLVFITTTSSSAVDPTLQNSQNSSSTTVTFNVPQLSSLDSNIKEMADACVVYIEAVQNYTLGPANSLNIQKLSPEQIITQISIDATFTACQDTLNVRAAYKIVSAENLKVSPIPVKKQPPAEGQGEPKISPHVMLPGTKEEEYSWPI